MDVTGIKNLKYVFIKSDNEIDKTLSLSEQITEFQEKTTIQNKLIAEQSMQIYWLIAELRKRDSRLSVV